MEDPNATAGSSIFFAHRRRCGYNEVAMRGEFGVKMR